jgi:hypothetical protein
VVEQQTRKLCEDLNSKLQETRRDDGVAQQYIEAIRSDLETTSCEFEMQLAAVEARRRRGCGGNHVALKNLLPTSLLQTKWVLKLFITSFPNHMVTKTSSITSFPFHAVLKLFMITSFP